MNGVEIPISILKFKIPVMGAGFEKYLTGFKPYLFHALDSHEEAQVCIAAIGVVSDLCRAFELAIAPLMDEVMSKLLNVLEDPKAKRAVKSHVLNCFGDVALALMGGYERYLGTTLKWLSDAIAAAQVTDPVGDSFVMRWWLASLSKL